MENKNKSKVEWRSIPGTTYMVSNKGKIKNAHGRILKPGINNHGYCYIVLCLDNHHKICSTVSRFEAYAFGLIDSLKDPRDIDHINSDKLDNNLENLQPMMHKESIKKRDATNRTYATPICVFDAEDDSYIDTYPSIKQAALELGLCRSDICFCLKGYKADDCKKPYESHKGYKFKYAEKVCNDKQ
jgi:hypothetical protein